MSNYYFLATSLPELKLGSAPDISFSELLFIYRQNLSDEDFEKIEQLRLLFDIENIRAFWLQEPLDPRGRFDENSLEEALLTGIGFPGYVYDFLSKHDELKDRLRHFPSLIAQYYREAIAASDGFLRQYLMFERGLRLVLVAFRAKKLNRDILVELQYENPDDPLIAQILSQKDMKHYDPPSPYELIKPLFEELADEPANLNKALVEYRFQKIDELIGLQVFTIDALLAYFIKFVMAEKWLEQDREKGAQLIKNIIRSP